MRRRRKAYTSMYLPLSEAKISPCSAKERCRSVGVMPLLTGHSEDPGKRLAAKEVVLESVRQDLRTNITLAFQDQVGQTVT